MALINCPECGKQVSDKAISCPNCGMPFQNAQQPNESSEQLQTGPQFPENMEIGEATAGPHIDGIYNQDGNTFVPLPSGKITLYLHVSGINIWSFPNFCLDKSYKIHKSQIISVVKTSKAQIIQAQKSVVGRAVVGSLIMGPIGGIVGGISGLQTKDQLDTQQLLVINFWEIKTKTPQSIIVQCDKLQDIDKFIYIWENKIVPGIAVADENTNSGFIWFVIILTLIVIFVLIYTVA